MRRSKPKERIESNGDSDKTIVVTTCNRYDANESRSSWLCLSCDCSWFRRRSTHYGLSFWLGASFLLVVWSTTLSLSHDDRKLSLIVEVVHNPLHEDTVKNLMLDDSPIPARNVASSTNNTTFKRLDNAFSLELKAETYKDVKKAQGSSNPKKRSSPPSNLQNMSLFVPLQSQQANLTIISIGRNKTFHKSSDWGRQSMSYASMRYQKTEPRQQGQRRRAVKNDMYQHRMTNHTKFILYYSVSPIKRDLGFDNGHQLFLDHACPVHDCHFTTMTHEERLRYNLSQFDAILFFPIAGPPPPPQQIQAWRRSYQRFVLLHMESPHLFQRRLQHVQYESHFFNWTMTYHWESDIPRPYGWFREKSQKALQLSVDRPESELGTTSSFSPASSFYPYLRSEKDWIPYNATAFRNSLPYRSKTFRALASRPGQVAWIASNCETSSQRERYVQTLQKYMNVTILGRCASSGGKDDDDNGRRLETWSSINKDYNNQSLFEQVEREYKFYLGFENAFCNDYVTEKLFSRLQNMVVVVLGQVNYSRVAPPHSYINALEYNHPRQLATYLQYLSDNPDEYLSYFWWQEYYDVQPKTFAKHDRMSNFAQSFCRLCDRLHASSEATTQEHSSDTSSFSSYGNISDWWKQKGQCNTKKLPRY